VAVARALPNGVSSPPQADALAALVALTRDANSQFYCTSESEVFSTLIGRYIREALEERLDDPEGDTAGEALVGLARRRDLNVVSESAFCWTIPSGQSNVRQLVNSPTESLVKLERLNRVAGRTRSAWRSPGGSHKSMPTRETNRQLGSRQARRV